MPAKKLYGILFSICIASSFIAGIVGGHTERDILSNNQNAQESSFTPEKIELKGRTFYVTRSQLLIHEGSNIIFLSGWVLGLLVFVAGRLWDKGYKQLPPMQAHEGRSTATSQGSGKPSKTSAAERRP